MNKNKKYRRSKTAAAAAKKLTARETAQIGGTYTAQDTNDGNLSSFLSYFNSFFYFFKFRASEPFLLFQHARRHRDARYYEINQNNKNKKKEKKKKKKKKCTRNHAAADPLPAFPPPPRLLPLVLCLLTVAVAAAAASAVRITNDNKDLLCSTAATITASLFPAAMFHDSN